MRCPICNGKTKVIDSRERSYLVYRYRDRKCVECGETFGTAEIPINQYKKLKNHRLECDMDCANCNDPECVK